MRLARALDCLSSVSGIDTHIVADLAPDGDLRISRDVALTPASE